MENNNEKKLALGEKVYILQGNDDKFSYVEAEVIKVSEREDWTYKPYYLKDRYGKLHIVYYPNSITTEEIITYHDFIDMLKKYKEYAKAEIERLERKSDRAEYLLKELIKECGKNGNEHVWGDVEETKVSTGEFKITGYVTDEGCSYSLKPSNEETKYRRTCQCCGYTEYVSNLEDFIEKDKSKTR